MGAERQKIQLELAFMAKSRGETPMAADKGPEASKAKRKPENPALSDLIDGIVAQPAEPPWYGPVCPVV